MLAVLAIHPTVESALRARAEATRTYDVPALESVFHPDYREISPIGEIDDRVRTISFYRERPARIPSEIRVDEIDVRTIARDLSLAIYRETIVIGSRELACRMSAVLRRDRKGWRFVHLHVVGIQPKRKAS